MLSLVPSASVVFAQAKAALPMLKARSAGGRQTRSRSAKTTPKRAPAPAKKPVEEKKADAGIQLDSHKHLLSCCRFLTLLLLALYCQLVQVLDIAQLCCALNSRTRL